MPIPHWMQIPPDADTTQDADPLDTDPLDADPLDADPPEGKPPLDAGPLSQVTCDACWYGDPPPLDRMTDTCENINLPQTSFVGGNKVVNNINKSCDPLWQQIGYNVRGSLPTK